MEMQKRLLLVKKTKKYGIEKNLEIQKQKCVHGQENIPQVIFHI